MTAPKPRGGRRPGAGRKRGSSTVRRRSAEIDKGILPLEMRLRVSRRMWDDACNDDGEIEDLEKAKAAAEFAEPAMRFTSPALSSIAVDASINLDGLNDGELEFLARIRAKASEPRGNPGGAGAAGP